MSVVTKRNRSSTPKHDVHSELSKMAGRTLRCNWFQNCLTGSESSKPNIPRLPGERVFLVHLCFVNLPAC